MAAGNDLIIGVGFLWQTALQASAVAHPDQKYGLIDAVAVNDQGTPNDFTDDVVLDNVASMVFAEEQGSFLVGAAAALKTKTGNIGFIGGVETDLIKKFEAGYTAGAKAVNPDIRSTCSTSRSRRTSPASTTRPRARRSPTRMYDDGADVIYSAAGGSGLGVFQAASEAGAPARCGRSASTATSTTWSTPSLQPYILTSMLKRVDVAVYETIKAFAERQFAAGAADVRPQGRRRRLLRRSVASSTTSRPSSTTTSSRSSPARSRCPRRPDPVRSRVHDVVRVPARSRRAGTRVRARRAPRPGDGVEHRQ